MEWPDRKEHNIYYR